MKIMNRRAVLRGAGGAAIALPFLDIMMPARPARAEGGITKVGKNGRPKRFVLVETFNGHGVRWFDNKMGPDGLQLGSVMAPMEKHGHKNDLILIDGINNQVAIWLDHINGGHDAMRTLTTARPADGNKPMGPSIDQAIAEEIAGDTKFKSVQFATAPGNGQNFLSVSRSAPLAPIAQPQKGFDRLFADFQTDPLVFEKAKARRKSVLDNVQANYQQFLMKVGRQDKVKIQTHLDAIRELEVRIGKVDPVSTGGVCSKPTIPATFEKGTERYISMGHAYMDLVAMAFACDLTRVATVDWNIVDVTGGPPFTWLPGAPLYHNLSHGAEDSQGWNDASTWLVDYQAGFIDRLKATQDGAGSVWDNTVFFWTSEVGTGNHTNYRQTWLVAGSGGGYFKTNQLIKLPYKLGGGYNQIEKAGIGHNDLFVSFLNAMGIPATAFGSPEFSRGAIQQMVA